jgi:hypothetical protein
MVCRGIPAAAQLTDNFLQGIKGGGGVNPPPEGRTTRYALKIPAGMVFYPGKDPVRLAVVKTDELQVLQ